MVTCTFRNRFGLKYIKITGEAATADEEGTAIFGWVED